jgi:hypothetical protein
VIPDYTLRLCTFEVATSLGRHTRLGSFKDGVIVDLNFATAWYMAQTGEAEPQRLADALVPSTMACFLRTGLRAQHTAEELFLGAGPHPADWWRHKPPIRGPRGETLAYDRSEVRLLSPLQDMGFYADGDELPLSGEYAPEIAAVIGRRAAGETVIAGYTLRNVLGARSALGPFVWTPDGAGAAPEITVRVNGEERLRCRPESAGKILEERKDAAPGEVIPCRLGDCGSGRIEVKPGDTVEIEATRIGRLRNRVV